MRVRDVRIRGCREVPAASGGMARDAGLAPAFLAVGKRRETREERADKVSVRPRWGGAEEWECE